MAWDEWEQLKSEAAERTSTGTRLNQVAVGPGPAASEVTGGVRSSRAAWVAAGRSVDSLRGAVTTALGKLAEEQPGTGGDAGGCLSASAEREVYASWKKYAEDVRKRCGSLAAIMARVGNEQLLTDEGVKAEISAVASGYADTVAVGGETRER
ncbi:hypothetical protein ACWEFL_29590 [Streptomyces sp. NPDC004838]